ncbi:MAG TPA: PPE family protein [Mycobacterium sp.]|nr:PPE family protein [Mycobacterium sp.]
MDFALLPPEVNSGLMYAGPGAAPMLAAAAAWDALAAALESAAAAYSAALTTLTAHHWSGPASAAMAAAAAPYVTWLHACCGKAEQTAMQAKSAVAAYESAFAATVPPATVAANRTLLATLIATNFFGQNLPAIAATEAQYAEMWAQDAGAMYGYAAASTAARTLPVFDQPPRTANPAAPSTQAAALSDAAAENGQAVTRLGAVLHAPLQQPVAPPSSSSTTAGLSAVTTTLNSVSPLTSVASSGMSFDSSCYTVSTNGAGWGRLLYVRGGVEGALTFDGLGPRGVLSAATKPMAGLGQATPLGKLSVPQSWVSAAPELQRVAVTLAAAETELPAAAGLPAGTAFQEAMMGTTAGQRSVADPAANRGQQTGKKKEDQDGRPMVTLTNGSGWLGSSWAYHNRRREGEPLPLHWRTG